MNPGRIINYWNTPTHQTIIYSHISSDHHSAPLWNTSGPMTLTCTTRNVWFTGSWVDLAAERREMSPYLDWTKLENQAGKPICTSRSRRILPTLSYACQMEHGRVLRTFGNNNISLSENVETKISNCRGLLMILSNGPEKIGIFLPSVSCYITVIS